MKKLRAPRAAVFAAVWIVLAALVPAALSPATGQETLGGQIDVCIASGILFGLAVLSGNGLAVAGAVVGAIHGGCLW